MANALSSVCLRMFTVCKFNSWPGLMGSNVCWAFLRVEDNNEGEAGVKTTEMSPKHQLNTASHTAAGVCWS